MEIASDENLIELLVPMVNRLRKDPHMTIRVHLGTLESNTLKPGVAYEYSRRLHDSMTNEESMPVWDSSPDTANIMYVHYDGHYMSAHSSKNPTAVFYKVTNHEPAVNLKCTNREYGLQVSARTEIPVTYTTLQPPMLVQLLTQRSVSNGPWSYKFAKVGQGITKHEACSNSSIQVSMELSHEGAYVAEEAKDVAILILGRARDLLGRYTATGVKEDLPLVCI